MEGRERKVQLKAKGGAEKGKDQWVKQWSVWVQFISRVKQREALL